MVPVQVVVVVTMAVAVALLVDQVDQVVVAHHTLAPCLAQAPLLAFAQVME